MDMPTLLQRVQKAAMKFKGVPAEQAGQDSQAVGASSSTGIGSGGLGQGQQGPLFQQGPGYGPAQGHADLLSDDIAERLSMMSLLQG
jgi:hypothetical protein